MRTLILVVATAAALALTAPAPAAAQGPPDHAKENRERALERARAASQGQAGQQGQDTARGQGRSQGTGPAAAQGARGRGGPPGHARAKRGGPAPDLAEFNRNVMDRAVEARGRRPGARPVEVRREGDGIRVVRNDGEELFALDRRTLDSIGYWRAAVIEGARERPMAAPGGQPGAEGREAGAAATGRAAASRSRYPADADTDTRGLPAFCRSGEGHPVWGRDWCLDKGFGLGDDESVWAIDRSIEDIILRRPDPERDTVDRDGLTDVLGDIVFGRLALQALVLGADQPLEGRWVEAEDGPRILRIEAGDLPVAEIVDYGRDGRADRILFNLGG